MLLICNIFQQISTKKIIKHYRNILNEYLDMDLACKPLLASKGNVQHFVQVDLVCPALVGKPAR